MLIESDMVPKALLDLIPNLNIRKLVVGTNKSSFRYIKPIVVFSVFFFLIIFSRL